MKIYIQEINNDWIENICLKGISYLIENAEVRYKAVIGGFNVIEGTFYLQYGSLRKTDKSVDDLTMNEIKDLIKESIRQELREDEKK